MIPIDSARRHRRLRALLSAIAFLAFAGCIQHTKNGADETFRYELWVPLVALFAGLVAVPAGWLLRKRSQRFGWGLVILGPLAVFVFAPSLFRDQVTLTDRGFHVRTGIWGITSVHDVEFDEIRVLKIVAETRSGRRGKRVNYFFLCEKKSGESVKVPVNNEVMKAGANSILERVSARGIPIVDDTQQAGRWGITTPAWRSAVRVVEIT